jgi:hypothetical protein
MNTIKTTYADIPIEYDEKRNLWTFELRGRARIAESLENAKKAIDAPVKEKKQFERFKAWHRESWEGWKQFDVTSIGEPARYGGYRQVWTSENGKKRALIRADDVFPVNDANNAIVAQWTELDNQVKALEDQKRKLLAKLQKYVIPQEEVAT